MEAHVFKNGSQMLMDSPWNCIPGCYVRAPTDTYVSGENLGISFLHDMLRRVDQ